MVNKFFKKFVLGIVHFAVLANTSAFIFCGKKRKKYYKNKTFLKNKRYEQRVRKNQSLDIKAFNQSEDFNRKKCMAVINKFFHKKYFKKRNILESDLKKLFFGTRKKQRNITKKIDWERLLKVLTNPVFLSIIVCFVWGRIVHKGLCMEVQDAYDEQSNSYVAYEQLVEGINNKNLTAVEEILQSEYSRDILRVLKLKDLFVGVSINPKEFTSQDESVDAVELLEWLTSEPNYLAKVIDDGDLQMFKLFSKNGFDGGSFLSEAIKDGDIERVKFLVRGGVSVDSPYRPLCKAIRAGNMEIAAFLVENGAPVDKCSHSLNYPLYEAIKLGDIEMVKFLIEEKADVNQLMRLTASAYGKMPLYKVVELGDIEMAKLFIENHAEVDAINELTGDTPLCEACRIDDIPMAKLLLESGANPNIGGLKTGTTPLCIAVSNRNVVLAELLLEYKADPNIKDKWTTPLLSACNAEGTELAILLFNNNADVYEFDPFNGNTALHEVCKRGNIELVKIFWDEGDWSVVNKDRETPLFLAIKFAKFNRGNNNFKEVIDFLREKGAPMYGKYM